MRHPPREKGFSLLLIVLIFVVVAAAAVGAVFFAAKIKSIALERQTMQRMLAIQAASRKYYRGHPDTGLPGSSPGDTPTADLNLPQNYRYDVWGKQFEYYKAPDVGGFPNITGVTVDGQPAAGYILSAGSDQEIDSVLGGGAIARNGDDVLLPINVQAEAIEITVAELTVLSQKSCAFIKANLCGTPLGDLITIYSLNDTYRRDSWGHDYQLVDPPGNYFYSYGPDGSDATTDDIYGPPLDTVNDCVCISPTTLPDPVSGFDFDAEDVVSIFGIFLGVLPSAGGASAWGLVDLSPVLGVSTHASGGADGGGYISVSPVLNAGLRVYQDIRPSTYPKLTVSVWVRSAVTNGTRIVFSTDTNATAQYERMFGQTGGNYAVSSGYSGGGVYSDGPVTTGATWHHLAAVYDQTVPEVTYYLDGVAVVGPSPADMPDNQVSQLGAYVYFIGIRGPITMFLFSQWSFNGDIDEFRIYTDALSAAQIDVLYHEFD